MPYSLTDHIHEREISRRLGVSVSFIPHVAVWFQGIHHTINIPLNKAMTSREIRNLYQDRYAGEKLIKVVGEAPLVKNISGKHGLVSLALLFPFDIGGFIRAWVCESTLALVKCALMPTHTNCFLDGIGAIPRIYFFSVANGFNRRLVALVFTHPVNVSSSAQQSITCSREQRHSACRT